MIEVQERNYVQLVLKLNQFEYHIQHQQYINTLSK
jgi:hypothetical protein